MRISILAGLALASAALAGCTTGDMGAGGARTGDLGTGLPGVSSIVPTERPDTQTASAEKHGRLDRLISAYSAAYEVPESLVHRVVKRESNYNPKAYHAGNYGLMQIRYRTAKGMGYEGGPKGLLDADTNLKYAVKYLKGAWLVAGGNEKRADRLYQTGYYYHAKRKGMLDRVGWSGTALAAVKPLPGDGPHSSATVVAAAVGKAAQAEPATVTASIEPVSNRFGEAAEAGAHAETATTPATAVAYTGSVPTGGQSLPGVMQAPVQRPGH